MTPRLLLTLVAVVLGAAVSNAQQKPNFTGRWVGVSPSEAAGQEQFVKHEGTTLTVSHAAEGDDHRFTYSLDGKESRNVLTSHGADIVTLSQATWKADQLTITSRTTYQNGSTVDQIQVWSIDAEGRLVVEISQTAEGQPPRSVKVVSVKK